MLALFLLGSCTSVGPHDSDTASDTANPPQVCDDPGVELVQKWTQDLLPMRTSTDHTEPGVGLGDLDGDGDLDALVAWGGGSFVLANDGAGNLAIDESFTVDGGPLPDAAAVALADLDGDGDFDAWLGRERDEPAIWLWNEGGTFTGTVQLEATTAVSTGAFGDANGDGSLDLVVANLLTDVDPQAVLDGTQAGIGNQLYSQSSPGIWSSEADLPATQAEALSFQAAWIDVEGDGDLDLYMGHVWGQELTPNQLYLNDGAGNFSLDPDCHCDKAMNSMGVAVGDANGDGQPDLYISDVGSGTLFVNDGAGAFYDATMASGTHVEPSETNLSGWGTTFADLDVDGCEDLFITYGRLASDGAAELESYQPEGANWTDPEYQANVWLRGNCEGQFERVENTALDANLVRDRGVSIGDLDGDGRPDLVTVGKYEVHQWKTTGGCGNAARLQLAGPPGNANGFGARVEWSAGGHTATRWMLPSSTHSTNALELYLGLGAQEEAEILVTWPDGAQTTHFATPGSLLVASP